MNTKRFLIIRHAKTKSSAERRYAGDPAEALCDIGAYEAISLRESGALPHVSSVLCGPAERCRQTAGILFPDIQYDVCNLTETDFGIFKGKNADELKGDMDYEKWLETDCMGDIPGGDSVEDFKRRCRETFLDIAASSGDGVTALIIHGGNIMSILEGLAEPKRDFYSYYIKNCGFYLCRFENNALIIEREGGPL